MTEDGGLFKELAQKLDFYEPEQTAVEAWLDKNKTVVVVVAMMVIPVLLYNTYCYFSNKDRNKMDGKKNEKNIKQEEDSDSE